MFKCTSYDDHNEAWHDYIPYLHQLLCHKYLKCFDHVFYKHIIHIIKSDPKLQNIMINILTKGTPLCVLWSYEHVFDRVYLYLIFSHIKSYLTTTASLYRGSNFNIKQASASSQWKVPSCVPIFIDSGIVTKFHDFDCA